MNKILLFSALCSLGGFSAVAQLPVSQTAQNRVVVLEEFTGMQCGYCPDGHKVAADIAAANPAGSVVSIRIHTGSLSGPNSGQPDFRTSEGAAIAGIPGMNVTSYPAGAINRHLFSGESNLATSRSQWAAHAGQILAMPAYVNVALEAEIDSVTRLLTVRTETYFTGAGAPAGNKINVVLLEEEVNGPQANYGNYNPAGYNANGTYNHNHMLRKALTNATTGNAIAMPNSSGVAAQTFTFIIPAQFVNRAPNLAKLRVAAYISEGGTEIVTGAYGPVMLTGKTAGVGSLPAFATSVTLAPNPTATQSTLSLSLEKGTNLSVQVVDMMGRVVNQIADQNLSAGTHKFPIATDNLAAGVYNVRIATAEGVVTQRLSVVK